MSAQLQLTPALAPRSLTRAEYDAIIAVRYSTLKDMRKSPLHYAHRAANATSQTRAMAMGGAVHTAVLEPNKFADEYAIFDGPRRAGKAWDAFEAANADRTILKVDEHERCLRIRDAVRAHPVARRILAQGQSEVSLSWIDRATGLFCKGRIDWLGPGVMADLKVTATLDARLMAATVYRMGTHLQQAFYRQGLREHGLRVECKVIAVEPEPPHDVGVFHSGPDVMEVAEEELRELLGRVALCRQSGTWPGRYPDEVPLELPGWVYADDGDGNDLGLTFGEGE